MAQAATGVDRQAVSDATVPPIASWISYAGAVPFVVGAAMMVSEHEADWWNMALTAYGAIILSFLGGVHWGLCIAQGQVEPRRLLVGALPALVGWLSVLAAGRTGLQMLLAAFALMLAYDRTLAYSGAVPAWYARLRLPVSLIVVVSLAVASWGSPPTPPWFDS
jgi:hypothetical protein